MVVAWINFRAQPHKRPEILSAVDEMIERMRNASGMRPRPAVRRQRRPQRLHRRVGMAVADDADAFFNSKHFQLFRGIRILLRGEPLIVFDEIQARVTRLFR